MSKNNMLDIIFKDAEEVVKRVDFDWLEGKTILVTGATGLLGTHFLATLALLKMGIGGMKIKVIASCYSKPADYTAEIAKQGGIEMMYGYNGVHPDAVIHAGGYAQPDRFTSNPAETIRINTTVTNELLSSMKPNSKFLFISSSEVYSGSGAFADEFSIGTTTPAHPRACYIEGKRCGEAIVNAYRRSGIAAKSARLGLAYGPGVRRNDQRAMSSFIRQALIYGKVEMQYAGLESRTYCYVRDAVEMLWNVLLHGEKSVYNISGASTITMQGLGKAISKIVGVETKLSPGEEEMKGSDGVIMNTNRYFFEFNKEIYVDLEEGLRNTIEWHKGLYELQSV